MAQNDTHGTISDQTVVKDLFGQVLEAEDAAASEEARAALEAAEPAVRDAVERLLSAHRRAAGMLLEDKPGSIEPALEPTKFTRPHIAGYEFHDEIGRGGFGVVYRAQQVSPVQRPVAIKILRTELASQNVISRFRAESRVLAKMNHPGIACVLDAGLDSHNRPFLAMELVDGEPLVSYCELHRLTVRQRVQLMVDVCEAVHHAHQRAVIHRDLKPANILVEQIDGRHRPRVIDFGIAKLIEEDGAETQTQEGAKLGTPRYMSPEQSEGTDVIDVRTDVYALGVLLCEALTGQVPRVNEGTGGASGSRSSSRATRPSQLAAKAASAPADLSRELRGDLDRIVLKAVSLDPEMRYASAAALGEDLERFLDGRAVLATPPGVFYLTRKFVTRHKSASAALGLAVVSLVGGTAAAMYGQARAHESRLVAEQERRHAELEATIATEINEFWIDIIERSSPQQARRPDLQVREALDLAAPRLEQHIGDPGVRRRLHETFSDAYQGLGLVEPQLHHARLAWQLLDESDVEDQSERVRASLTLATALMEAHQLDEARTVVDAALELCRPDAALQRQLPLALQILARIEERDGDFEKAEAVYREAVNQAHRLLGPRHLTTLVTERGLALTLVNLSRAQEAVETLEPLVERMQQVLGADHPELIGALTTLINAWQMLGQFDEADRGHATLLDLSQSVLGEDHPYIMVLMNNRASLLRDQRRFEEAEAVFRDLRDAYLRISGVDHPNTLRATANLAMSLVDQQKYEESERFLMEVIDGRGRVLGDDHPDTINARQVLASVYSQTGRVQEAAELYGVLLEQLRQAVPPGHIRLAPVLRNYGVALEKSGDFEQAVALYIESYEILLNVAGPDHPQTQRGMGFICDALEKVESIDDHSAWRDRCAERH